MPFSKVLHVLGYGSGMGAALSGAQDGPAVIQHSAYLKTIIEKGLQLDWHGVLKQPVNSNLPKVELITELCKKLAQAVCELAEQNKFFCVLGGDHSCGLGTWSGLSHALKAKGNMGLIWIDAHMDSHTHDTTPSGNIHGMPIAGLLGYGMPSLTHILNNDPKILPENLCLIGVRSFERGEAALLKKLNIRIYFMDEVKERGFAIVLQEAMQIVSQNTVQFGISLDIDSITPEEAPGTGCPVPHGITTKELYKGLQIAVKNPKLAGFEIAEFDPHRDKEHKTEKIVAHVIATLGLGTDCQAFFKDTCACTEAADL